MKNTLIVCSLPDQIIGTSLKRACQKKGACDRQGIPTILNELMEKIVIQKGTLRASGNVGNVDKIVTGINKNQKLKDILKEIDAAKIDKTASYGTKILAKMFGYFNSPTYAIHTHTLANTLKRIFSTMHPSLIPYYLDKVILEHSEEHTGDAECFYRAILNRLEPSNYNTLKKLIVFLKKVVEQSEMDDNGVATCIANSILHSPPLVVADTETWEGSHRSPAGSSESLHDSAGSARHVRRPKSNPSTGSTPGIPHEQNTAIHYITFVEYLIVHYKSVFDMYKY